MVARLRLNPVLAVRAACAALVVLALLDVLRRVAGCETHVLGGVLDDGFTPAIDVAAAAAVVLRVVVRAHERRAWAAIAAYATVTAAAEVGWAVQFRGVPVAPVPNWTDALYLVAYVFAALGVGLLLRAQLSGRVRLALWLDGIVAGLAITAVCAAFVLAPSAHPSLSSGPAAVVTTAYPVLDLVLLGLVGAAYAVRSWRVGWSWLLLGGALIVLAAGDAAFWWATGRGGSEDASWIDGLWPLSLALVACAAWAPDDPRPRRARADWGVIEVPLAFAAIALVVLVRATTTDVGPMAVAAAAAALVVKGVRTWMTHRENVRLLLASRREADEDGLTGLPNRRRLMRDLDLAFGPSTGPSTLVFLDLDGFKPYNDAHGHAAGDELLMEMGSVLAAAVTGGGAAYRLGGDEFCMLLPGALTGRDPRIAAAVEALESADGEGVGVGASSGIVVLPREAATPSAALRLADRRMYEDKGFRRGLRPSDHTGAHDRRAPGDRRTGVERRGHRPQPRDETTLDRPAGASGPGGPHGPA